MGSPHPKVLTMLTSTFAFLFLLLCVFQIAHSGHASLLLRGEKGPNLQEDEKMNV